MRSEYFSRNFSSPTWFLVSVTTSTLRVELRITCSTFPEMGGSNFMISEDMLQSLPFFRIDPQNADEL